MKKRTTTRTKSLITGEADLEPLVTFHNFPAFIGATSEASTDDVCADMEWMICRRSGMIQLARLLPLELVYSQYHSEAIGGVWTEHHSAFCSFLEEYHGKHILEVGGSNGALAKQFIEKNTAGTYSIIEPNPSFNGNDRIKVIKGFFDVSFKKEDVDTIVHSHTLEHMYDPLDFLCNVRDMLSDGQRHVFSIPHLESYLANKYSNTLNFEHTYFLTEHFTDFLLAKHSFRVLEKRHFRNHSIFYATEKDSTLEPPTLASKYTEYKKLYLDMVDFYTDEVERLNSLMCDYDGEVFLFGAHVFSQFLHNRGLSTERVSGILDNSTEKRGKRLYGTPWRIEQPAVLENKGPAAVILKVGQYQEEVRAQLRKIRADVVIWE